MKNWLTLHLLILLICYNTFSQKLPKQFQFTNNNHTLKIGGVAGNGIYDLNKVHEIKMYFSQPNYWSLLTSNYRSKTNLLAKIVVNGKELDSVGIRFKGQTSFMGPSQKKSFDIELDGFIDGQDYEGYNTLNLNNSFQDPSFMREVFYYHTIRNHSPAAQASFVRLYINDQDWGIYQNIQQLNKDFLEEWWADNDGTNFRADSPPSTLSGGGGGGAGWGDGTAALNYLGEDTSLYQRYYTLKSDDSGIPWNHLKNATKLLSETPIEKLHTDLDAYFDIDKILWHLATEVLFADDDSYIFKGKMDYYTYRDNLTNRFSTFDYDGNSVMINKNINWSPFYNEEKVNYPLMNKLLKNQIIRQRFIAHLNTLITQYCDPLVISTSLEKFSALINNFVSLDPKKATSYQAFLNEQNVLKNFMSQRKNILLTNAEMKEERPEISQVQHGTKQIWESPKKNEKVLVEVKANHTKGISNVTVYYGTGLHGRMNTQITLNDAGLDGDKIANDKIYSASIPGQNVGTWVRYYAEAIANNTAKSAAYFPKGAEHEVMIYQVQNGTSIARDVVINEFMASNDAGPKDEKGQFEDWIEIYNTTNTKLDLSGWYLSDDATRVDKFPIPNGISIEPKGYIVFWCDEDQAQGLTHTNFKLSASTETLLLSNNVKEIVDSFTYFNAIKNKTYARLPNGVGNFQNGTTPTFSQNNNPLSTTSEKLLLEVYPNPISDFIHVKSSIQEDIIMTNLNGQELLQFHVDKSVLLIDVSHLPDGMYFLKSKSGYIKKVIKL
jgi:hypothetical protein